MIDRPTKTEVMLERLAGPAVMGWSDFLFKVFMGVLSIPIMGASWVGLRLYRALLWLHWSGEETIAALNQRFYGRRD